MTTTQTRTRTQDFALHRQKNDHWIDEVRLVCKGGELRLVTQSYRKESGLSGTIWRTRTLWQVEGFTTLGNDFDKGFGSRPETGCAALYPRILRQPHLHSVPVERIEFRRKGRVLFATDCANKPLLTTAGGLPWALVTAGDFPLGTDEAWADHARLCGQPGCCEPAVVRYQLRQCYTSDGVHALPAEDYAVSGPIRKVPLVVQFCGTHRNRGDSDMEDRMANYIPVDLKAPTR